MFLLTIAFIGIASNLDNLGIGFSYGIQGKRISISSNMMMSLMGTLFSFLFVCFGHLLSQFIPPSFSNYLGGSIIMLIGLWSIITEFQQKAHRAFKKTMENPDHVDKDHNNIISMNEAFILGIALSCNAIGIAFGAGIAGANAYLVAIAIGLFSYLSIDLGTTMGLKLQQSRLAYYAGYVSGFLLVLIGIFDIIH
ncbi:hypothetical protein GMB86_01925 [Terrilactibacillus sp. BCM23-1]|uniref:Sporulation membrane protein YtaF n=1 Tax=Terrilactibacillus tamarindi TaxID=2599694 RepID=A0A6N8CLH6_9BACI|nr:manganese efflux pump [Terrilactibacillus tamarindi]MTT30772.1 hypothetical protein [Terrilactibacillus tamarindi]